MTKVITYGTFDLFHEGHYKLLQRAKALGDYLIVGVTTEHFDEARGKVNVIDPILERIENVRKTGFADEIIVEDHVGPVHPDEPMRRASASNGPDSTPPSVSTRMCLKRVGAFRSA